MEALKNKILTEGIVISETVLQVDRFLNHQIDPMLMQSVGTAFYQHYANEPITKVLTLESSGIAPAMMTALSFQVPCIFARKKKSLTLQDHVFTTTVTSFTKKEDNPIFVSKDWLKEEDHVLIIDDFLANGQAAEGLLDIVQQSGASLAGFGAVIEKGFQAGGEKLRQQNINVCSLAIIASLKNQQVTFA
ncbi:xanthine phosphoribosyltransferase [Bacillaceae bacterium SIJ1]|uniref:xanthine phosphoribosyltransferase n=1 Tax=Litoribacterium kuwaitense TaxID=1398745 RepID=UPI0013EBC758|nr:xanthine phosphoribosyltransferase [Litoribacterium kuwaitense]NGP43761.1 xanthine phosphoribosyltransferase [Litoribacterium kuwaitense]